ncbi:MAG: protease inhibitor I42 family protein [Bacillota bacterium]|nr:protease inhibitor I42 family protein [Bacillota bacterium]
MTGKRTLVLVAAIALVAALTLSGCASEGARISQGEATIVLKSNPTTGFDWYYTVDNEGIVLLVKDEYKTDNPNLIGSGGMHTWIFQGVQEGTVKLTFKYYRSWEGESSAIDTREYTIVVGENGKIESVAENK